MGQAKLKESYLQKTIPLLEKLGFAETEASLDLAMASAAATILPDLFNRQGHVASLFTQSLQAKQPHVLRGAELLFGSVFHAGFDNTKDQMILGLVAELNRPIQKASFLNFKSIEQWASTLLGTSANDVSIYLVSNLNRELTLDVLLETRKSFYLNNIQQLNLKEPSSLVYLYVVINNATAYPSLDLQLLSNAKSFDLIATMAETWTCTPLLLMDGWKFWLIQQELPTFCNLLQTLKTQSQPPSELAVHLYVSDVPEQKNNLSLDCWITDKTSQPQENQPGLHLYRGPRLTAILKTIQDLLQLLGIGAAKVSLSGNISFVLPEQASKE